MRGSSYTSFVRCAAVAGAAAFAACGGGSGGGLVDAGEDPTGDGSVNGFSRRLLLEHVATKVLIPTYEQFVSASDALGTSLDAYCAALDGTGDPVSTRQAAHAAWRTAIDVWQRAEAVLVGPVAMDFNAIRNRIYSWPLVASCDIDQDVATLWTAPASYSVATRFDSARSMATIERLLFTDPADQRHACVADPTGWAEVRDHLPAARCRLAAVIAADVTAQAQALVTAWRPDGGNYLAELVEAGTSRSTIPSAHEAVNRISDGLFYVDKMVKDMKIGESAGIVAGSCATIGEPCLDEVEHRRANHGKAAVVANLGGLRAAFTGSVGTDEGPAFDDFLREVGATGLADRMVAEIDASIAAVNAIPGEMNEAIFQSRTEVAAAHAAVKTLTDDLKSQFLTVLSLDIPDDVAGDND